ncbi:MAG TPA: DUF4884 domain-containing protein [Noviherbaspirillum sp.]|nr:DUF4884 domain-containing protein [Noviherbaspirillum sp.]
MKKAFILLVAIALLGCGKHEPPSPVAKATTQNGYNVAKIFEHDGCAMYRFYDEGYYRYFAKCGKQQQVTEEHSETCGKGCTRRIQTTTIQDADK